MPNNIAYIWHNVHHYGYLDCDKKNKNIIIYEKRYNMLYTHYYNYEKGVRKYKRKREEII